MSSKTSIRFKLPEEKPMLLMFGMAAGKLQPTMRTKVFS